MSKAVKEFLATCSPAVRQLALKARSLILEVIPGVQEQVDQSAKIIGYGFGPKYADLVCVLMPVKAGVNLGFYRAMELPDPKGVLQGTGKLHRHVKLKSKTDVAAPPLRAMLNAALTAYRKRSKKRDTNG
ncbi:MAG: DUF1801 domain-containing protein [Planctomycetes bacterium]|nr:DUF1801 domain-containing protein [Planctomycetota bacterium]